MADLQTPTIFQQGDLRGVRFRDRCVPFATRRLSDRQVRAACLRLAQDYPNDEHTIMAGLVELIVEAGTP